MRFHFKVRAAFINKISNKSSRLHFVLQDRSFCYTKKGPKFNLNSQSQAAQESDVSGLSSSSVPSLTDHATHLRQGAAGCLFDTGATRKKV